MKYNYCLIKENNIYAEIYDELLDEELNMNNLDHSFKIKQWIEKKINSSNYINISNYFNSKNEVLEDIILKISSDVNNDNLQGNTLMISCDENSVYELFYMEDLTKPIPSDKLNEFGSISNIFLQPVCWNCGILKSSYVDTIGVRNSTQLKLNQSNSMTKSDLVELDSITKSDIVKIFLDNFYHQGVMLNIDGSMIEIEFVGEDPFKTIGTNYVQSRTFDLFGFNFVPFIEKNSKSLNCNATKLIGNETNGRVFLTLVCPNTNKKYWNINSNTIIKILSIIDNDEIKNKISKDIINDEININPFYYIKKYV